MRKAKHKDKHMLRALLRNVPKILAATIILAGLSPLVYSSAQELPEAYEQPIYDEENLGALAANTTRLTWQHDLKTSLRMAKQAQKLVLIDVYTDWCGWCKRLDRDVYANAKIAQFVDSQFVPLKIDAEDGGEGQAFAKKLEIRGYPCTVVLDGAGNVKGMFYGYRKPNEFPAELAKAAGIQANLSM